MRWTLSVPLLLLTCLQPTKTDAINSTPLDIWCLDDDIRAQEDLMEYVGDDLQNCNVEESKIILMRSNLLKVSCLSG